MKMRKIYLSLLILSLSLVVFTSLVKATTDTIGNFSNYFVVPNITAISNSSFNYVGHNNIYTNYFTNDSYLPNSFSSISQEGYSLNFTLQRASYYNSNTNTFVNIPLIVQHSTGIVNGNNISFQNAWTNTNFTYSLNNSETKEIMQITSLPANISVANYFEYQIDISYNSSLPVCYIDINSNYICFTNQNATLTNTTERIDFLDKNNVTQFFLPAPTIIDTANHTVKATFFLNLTRNKIQLYLAFPYSYLWTASYPIFLDPTTDTVANGASANDASGQLNVYDIVASSSGTLSTIGINIASTGNTYTVGIYDKSGSYPNNLLGSGTTTPVSTGWDDVTISGGVPINMGTNYYIGVIAQNSLADINADTTSSFARCAYNMDYGALPSTWPNTNCLTSWAFDVRMTYSAITTTTTTTTTTSTTTPTTTTTPIVVPNSTCSMVDTQAPTFCQDASTEAKNYSFNGQPCYETRYCTYGCDSVLQKCADNPFSMSIYVITGIIGLLILIGIIIKLRR